MSTIGGIKRESNNTETKFGKKVGLFEEFRKVVNYFPRKFARSVLETKEGRDNFEDLLVKYNHANPIKDRDRDWETLQTIQPFDRQKKYHLIFL